LIFFKFISLATWEAGFFLAEFIVSNSHLFNGKHILELGAGIGLTSVAMCKLTKPKKVLIFVLRSSFSNL
jgi:predicted nicotinamide N-methyase